MGLVLEPKVTVISYTKFQGHPDYEVPPDGNNFERGLTFATKGCYHSFGPDGRACLENQKGVINHGHGSVLEHGYISLFIEGVSRALTLELNRHRHLNVSQRSTRYVAEENGNIVLDPYLAYLIKNSPTRREKLLVESFCGNALSALERYKNYVDGLEDINPLGLEGFDLRKWARGKARGILPSCLETKGTWTGNIRTWRHIIELRSSRHAEPEIRRLMKYIYEAVSAIGPVYFEDFEATDWPKTEIENYPVFPEYTTPHSKI